MNIYVVPIWIEFNMILCQHIMRWKARNDTEPHFASINKQITQKNYSITVLVFDSTKLCSIILVICFEYKVSLSL